MVTGAQQQGIQTLEITKQEAIAAPIEVVFETLLEHLGPLNETGTESPLPMKLEAWPGGRWYRDLGNNSGHFWGHVQVIKPPTLLEISGPLFMSCPAVSHVQYRLTADGNMTRLTLTHRAIGLLQPEHRRVGEGWDHFLGKVRDAAQRRGGTRQGEGSRR